MSGNIDQMSKILPKLQTKHLGYCAMFEQFHPNDMLDWCVQAEQCGFGGVMASDHFAPWVPAQGHSAFVWTWLGAYGLRCRLPVGTAVTPVGYRFHPAVVAHMAATVEAMYPGLFWLGLGAGEALNEHVVAGYWPEGPERVERLLESVEIIRKLFTGKDVKHAGRHFKMETCRLWTMPEIAPPIIIASSGPVMSKSAGRLADGFMTAGAKDEKLQMLLAKYQEGRAAALAARQVSGGDSSGAADGRRFESSSVEAAAVAASPTPSPRLLQVHVSWDVSKEKAVENALREWPNGGMNFAKADIRTPDVFEAIAKLVRPEDFAGRVFISADLQEHVEYLRHLFSLGFDGVYVHNVGRNQSEFIREYGRHVLPNLGLRSEQTSKGDS